MHCRECSCRVEGRQGGGSGGCEAERKCARGCFCRVERVDKEVVLEGVKRHRSARKDATAGLKGDKEVVLEAVKQHKWTP